MFKDWAELKLSILSVVGYSISLADFNAMLQAGVLVVSFITGIVALIKAIKHKIK